MGKAPEEITVCDGKYTLIMDDNNMHALRYGEPWRSLIGDGFVMALGHEILDLRAKVAELTDGAAKDALNQVTKITELSLAAAIDRAESADILSPATKVEIALAKLGAEVGKAVTIVGERAEGVELLEKAVSG